MRRKKKLRIGWRDFRHGDGQRGRCVWVGRILQRPLQARHADSCVPPWQTRGLRAHCKRRACRVETSDAFPFSAQHRSKGCGRTRLCHLGQRAPEALWKGTQGPTRLHIGCECRTGAGGSCCLSAEHMQVLKSSFPSSC